jgi:hypothetical protein
MGLFKKSLWTPSILEIPPIKTAFCGIASWMCSFWAIHLLFDALVKHASTKKFAIPVFAIILCLASILFTIMFWNSWMDWRIKRYQETGLVPKAGDDRF